MFSAIKIVSRESLSFARAGQCSLQRIHNIIEAYTKIDQIFYVRYDAEPENPIWGEFLRWEQFAPYQGEQTKVEIRYASHLDDKWKRFVVCKELAHSLDARKGVHTVQDVDVKSLITELSLTSAAGVRSLAVSAEKIAEAGALEMLLPLALRKEVIAANAVDDALIKSLSDQHEIPEFYVGLGFNSEYNGLIEGILAAFPD
ncbi:MULTISPECIES: hypothetical protein [unclassified Mesorhizobium]|uniref:hypothetical protein n=1 Tax=unclassified Mesorhizobium TaxID=325217 RepID=UPI001093EA92|nr:MULTISPECIES: hypothetical protein [unclassified Mesorhizobium]TGS45197.1 hypothetical protein EN825_15635 [Mesorhizobium sp. M8A.F.Ca.ET.182.01.1.1]TGS80897.1 hypothetical protein EN824_15870 [Mesorhizobium sp. M8A.F.Ca.ET.181.01.1.1]